jgi:hypothetical protein
MSLTLDVASAGAVFDLPIDSRGRVILPGDGTLTKPADRW